MEKTMRIRAYQAERGASLHSRRDSTHAESRRGAFPSARKRRSARWRLGNRRSLRLDVNRRRLKCAQRETLRLDFVSVNECRLAVSQLLKSVDLLEVADPGKPDKLPRRRWRHIRG